MDSPACEMCGVDLSPRARMTRPRRFCSDPCRHRAKNIRKSAERIRRPCRICAKPVPTNYNRYCCDECRSIGNRARDARKRRSLGIPLVEEYRAQRAIKARKCEACGAEYVARHKATKTCSYECGMWLRTIIQGGAPHTEFACLVPWDRLAPRSPYSPPICCVKCSSTFPASNGKRWSKLCAECKRRNKRAAGSAARHRSRALRYGVSYDPSVNLLELAERDRWTCHICCDPVLKGGHRSGASHPMGPSIDHILPMSLGGSHTWDNVALAHHRCNMLKSNRVQVAA